MNREELLAMNLEQQFAMYIALVVRNAMEAFHVEHLSDEQMALLNPIIRNAIYTAVHAQLESDHNEMAARYVQDCLAKIPKYWEHPQLAEDYLYMVSGKWQEDVDRLSFDLGN